MDGFYSNSNPRIQRLKAINGNAPSIHANTEPLFFAADGRGYIDPYASDDMESTLMRYLRSGSPADGMINGIEIPVKPPNLIGSGGFNSRSPPPLSAMENMVAPMARSLPSPPVFRAPVKVEEDVLVMDESPLGRMRSSLPSDSGGVSPSSGYNSYKTEMCRAWEDIGNCRYANKCQFAHGKEELRPTRFLNKNKPEELLCKSYHRTGYCPNSSKCRFVHRAIAPTAAAEFTPFDTTRTLATSTSTPAHQKLNIYSSSNQGNTITATGDWLPQDDGIPLMLSSSSSSSSSWTHEKQQTRKDVDAYINGVLYGTAAARRKRLLVFSQICPYVEE